MDPAAERLAPLLSQLVNYERTRPDRRLWDLATMRALLARPGAPTPPRPAVQVGGSKGKGTTTAMLAALATAAGRRAGTYTSPHISTLLERIRIGDRDIRTEQLESLLQAILAAPAGERKPTFFEAMTLCAADWFAQQRVDLAVYEVGLGGRHDATSALPVDAGIVTMIELEHTDVLGDTIAQIAGEKAPVIRPGGTGFTGTTGEAFTVVHAHCVANGARLFALDRDFGLRAVRWSEAGASGRLWLQDGRELPFVLPGAAAFELPALALAAAAFVHLLPTAPLVLEPAPRPQLPCRFEVRAEADGEVLVLDGAHTEHSLRMVGSELQRRWPGRKAALLFGSATGKRWQQGLSALLGAVDSVVVTELVGTTGEDPAAIAAFLTAAGVRNEVVPDAATGLRLLRGRPGPRLVAGSFYLAGQVRALVDAEPSEPHR
ncbi:MAG: Mur ligase family protein [Planctomycetes bacterium]|nr:Mur ligase family protein [Planctomycetota bacterium]